MSSPLTAAFLAAWRSLSASRVALVKIDIATPSALTLRFGTTGIIAYGEAWETGLECDPIRKRVEYLQTGFVFADCSFRLANRDTTWGRLSTLLATNRWQGATVTVYRWEQSLTDFATDAAQMFVGTIDRIDHEPGGVRFYAVESRAWNKTLPTVVIDKQTYPDAPEVANGLPVPIIAGDFSAIGLRSPWAAALTNKDDQEDSGAGSGVVPGIVVDPGTGAADVKVLFASHACAEIFDRADGRTAFITGSDTLNPILASGVTSTLSATESYLEIADDSLKAYAAIIPTDVRTGAGNNTASEPRRAMDVFDETSYATIEGASGKLALELALPSFGNLGAIEAVEVVMAYSGDAANTNVLSIYPRNPNTGVGGAGISTAGAPTSTTPTILRGAWTAAWWTGNWDFGGIHGSTAPDRTTIDITVNFAGTPASQYARIYWVALVVRYRPRRSLVVPANQVTGPTTRDPIFTRITNRVMAMATERGRTFTPAIYQVDAQFFANVIGAKDDGSGTYTGSAAAAIERAPDIALWLLNYWAGISMSDIETGSLAFGSFADARTHVTRGRPGDFDMAMHLGQLTRVSGALDAIGEQSLMLFLFDSMAGKWQAHTWRAGTVVDYDRVLSFERADFTDPECGLSSDVDVLQGVRVRYLFDHYKNRTLREAFVTATASGQGFTHATTRDQLLEVVAGVNDDLDFVDTATRAVVLAAGTYTPAALAVELQTKLNSVGPADKKAGYGFSVVAGFNDKLDFSVSAVVYVATLDEGDYSVDQFMAEVSRAMNVAGNHGLTFSVTRTSSGTLTVRTNSATSVTLLCNSGANAATSVIPMIGQANTTDLTGTAVGGGTARYQGHFWMNRGNWTTDNLDALWASGASAATNCALLLGFDSAADDTAATSITSDYSRGDRETQADASATAFGPREELVVTADWVREERVAVNLRDAIFDLRSTPRPWFRFKSHRVPDMQLFRVFTLDDSLDSIMGFPRYGSDGSFAGKTMRALEIEHDMGPSFHDEVYAVEA